MKQKTLAERIKTAASGATVDVEAGEFVGPFLLDRPVRLVGRGNASVLWAPSGPVVKICAPEIELVELAIEVASVLPDQNHDAETVGIALEVDQKAWKVPPRFQGIHLRGMAVGLPNGHTFRIPSVIDFGFITKHSMIERTASIDMMGEVEIAAELAGLEVHVEQRTEGRCLLKLRLDHSNLISGGILEGQLVVRTQGLQQVVRLTGQMVTDNRTIAGENAMAQGLLSRSVSNHLRPTKATTSSVEPNRLLYDRSVASLRLPPTPAQVSTPLASASREQIPSTVATLRQEVERLIETDQEAAILLLTKIIQMEPKAIDEQATLGRLYMERNLISDACRIWEAVLAQDPAYPEASLKLSACYNLGGNYAKSAEVLEQGLRIPANKQSWTYFRTMAFAYHQIGRIEEALWALDEAQKLRFDANLTALRRLWSNVKR